MLKFSGYMLEEDTVPRGKNIRLQSAKNLYNLVIRREKDISDSSKDFIEFCLLVASCIVGSKLDSDVAGTGYINMTDCQNISGFDMAEESNTIQV